MPLYGTYLQRDCYRFFENLEENLEFTYNKDDISDVQKTKEKIEKNIKLFDEVWLDMMYEGEHSDYYDKFAKDNNEEKLLQASDYVLFDLDEYYIELPNGNYRSWIYEVELFDIRKKLKAKQCEIEDIINTFNVNAGITLALLRN